jgi:hypothetical protein
MCWICSAAGRTSAVGAAPAGTDLLIEVRGRLQGLLRRRVDQKPLVEADLNTALVPPMWRRAVLNNPALDGAGDNEPRPPSTATAPP